jgi:hypothetical protein
MDTGSNLLHTSDTTSLLLLQTSLRVLGSNSDASRSCWGYQLRSWTAVTIPGTHPSRVSMSTAAKQCSRRSLGLPWFTDHSRAATRAGA